MTEQEWLACDDPGEMLDFLFDHPGCSERKLRLFAVACYRQVSEFHYDDSFSALFKREIKAIERYADGLISMDKLIAAHVAHYRRLFPEDPDEAFGLVEEAGEYALWIIDWAADHTRHAGDRSWPAGAAEAKQADLLRDLFGNPFRTVAVDPSWLSWNDGTIPKMARTIYDERHFQDLPALADALEEAGCTDPALLVHCRDSCEHVRGCWVLDRLLGKQ